METLVQNIKFAFRMLLKNPGFTAVAIIVLAVGIGSTTAVFSVTNSVLLRPLPYRDSERLIRVFDQAKDGLSLGLTEPEYVDFRQQNRVFDDIGGYVTGGANVIGLDEPERLTVMWGTASVLKLLGVEPAYGRIFNEDEDQPGKDNVILLSYGAWQRRFGGDRGILGRTVNINGLPRTVLGIMPRDFQFPNNEVDIWMPLGLDMTKLRPADRYISTIARLRPGVTLAQANAEMDAIAQNIQQTYSARFTEGANVTGGVNLVPLNDYVVRDVRGSLYILLAAVLFVLLISSVNVTNLLLVKGVSREKEVAIRTAVGASRGRIIGQLITESVIISILGGAFGLFLAYTGLNFLISIVPPETLPRADEIKLDNIVLGFGLLISVLTGLVSGVVPAFQTSKVDMHESLKDSGDRTSGGVRKRRLLGVMVVAEIMMAFVLLICAGLMIRSFIQLNQVDPGFNPDGVLTMRLTLPSARYKDHNQVSEFFSQLIEKAQGRGQITAIGAVNRLPLTGASSDSSFQIMGRPSEDQADNNADYLVVTPGYFEVMGVRLLRGRAINASDAATTQPVVVINEKMARRYWPQSDPIGQQISVGAPDNAWMTIVGIIEDVKNQSLVLETKPEMYIPRAQMQHSKSLGINRAMTVVARTQGNPLAAVPVLKGELRSLDSYLPAANIQTMETVFATSISKARFTATLFIIFAAMALILAAVGVYSIMAYFVTQRTREIGIRMALGASRRDIFRLIVRQGMALVVIGLVIGLAASFATTHVLTSLVYGVSITDPITFLGISALLSIVALVAILIPARKATRVDPLTALRFQ